MKVGEWFCHLPYERYCDMQPLRLATQTVDAPKLVMGIEQMAFLNHLRFVSMQCRTKPRTQLFEACALLAADKTKAQTAHAEALMRCLNEALGKPARLLSPGVTEMTFDERWLTQLGQACATRDEDSVRFLLGSRVSFENRRLVRFLVGRITEYFSLD